ncbi:hypothetical protein BFW38_05840 [Terasakiispira papahanaumokuakeensis]|uniref:DUF6708 domain-containing protein n=1 Tax=Terasakiispira papahanaumokuakeensis TaxID=197479 RepID=A0A1E2V8G9_9GAMM|nr:hypothetical protein BFW38_05840 [Terasakiispira papahanaumokuakeensis]
MSLSDSYLFRRGMHLGLGGFVAFFIFFIPFFTCIGALLLGAKVSDVILGFLGVMPMAVLAASFTYVPIKYELDCMPVSPVVFNRKTGRVYFFGEISGEAQSYPWHQCHFSVVHMATFIGYHGRHYELRGYILDEQENVIDSFSFGAEYVIWSIKSEPLKDFMVGTFEYIRRFMDGENLPRPDFYLAIRPDWKSFVSRVVANNYDGSWLTRKMMKFSIVFAICSFPQYFGYKLCWKNGRFPVWPKQFIDECGPEIVIER